MTKINLGFSKLSFFSALLPHEVDFTSNEQLDMEMEHMKSSLAAESRETVARVSITDAATQVIDTLREKHGELMFHQSGGCCDGSQPMCFAKGEFRVGSNDVWVGTIHGCDFFMNADQFEYWKHTHLTIGITPGRGSSFSLEIPLELRFIVKSRLFTTEESENLSPVLNGEDYLAQQK